MSKPNSITAKPVTTLTIHVLIEGRDILLEIFKNNDIAKRVLIGITHVEPRSVYALNETTFLVIYLSGILAEDIGTTIEKINDWLGKPVVITCDEVTATQLPQALEHACHTPRVESVVFNTGLDDEIQTESIPSVCSGYQSYAGRPAVLGALDTTFLNKIPGIPWFSGSEHEKDAARFEQWLHSISDSRRNFSEQLVKAATGE